MRIVLFVYLILKIYLKFEDEMRTDTCIFVFIYFFLSIYDPQIILRICIEQVSYFYTSWLFIYFK